jgi:hypothetical protein
MNPLHQRRTRVPIGSAVHGTVHAVQFYETDDYLVETLSAYTATGLAGGEAVVVVATDPHRSALDDRLAADGVDLAAARERGAYVSLGAAALLARFTVDGALSRSKFAEIVGGVIARARGEGGTRPVRVFGEMVALLWAEGKANAALELEGLWNELGRRGRFALLCAYPTSLFNDGELSTTDVADITSTHDGRAPAAN